MANVIRQYVRDNVLVGQARPFIQPYDPAVPPVLPADSIPLNGVWGGNWVELGATTNGLEFDFARKTKKIMVEEQQTPVAITTTDTTFTFAMELSEDTLDTMRLAYGGGTITTIPAGVGQLGIQTLQISSELTNFSFGFEGVNEKGFWRRVLVPVVVSVASAKTQYQRADKQRTYKVQFESLVDPTQVTIRQMTAVATG
jgi:hypothetical protein